MLVFFAALLIHTEKGHQYETEEKKKLLLVEENTVNIVIVASVEHIKAGSVSESAFNLCRSRIKSVSFEEGSALVSFGASLLRSTSVVLVNFSNCHKLKRIEYGCCNSCGSLRTFIFPPNLEVLGGGALHGSGITELTFPDSLRVTEEYTGEYGCTIGYSSVKKIYISKNSNLTEIGTHTFYNSWQLESFFIPKKVTSLGNGVFCLCPIKKFEIDPENPSYSTDGKTIYNKAGNTIISISTYDDGTNYTIRSNVTSVKYQAFRNVPAKTIIYTNQFLSFESSPLYNSNIAELTFPTGITSIINGFAQHSYSLVRVVLHDKITKICSSAFSNCVSLKEVILSKNLKTIESNAFAECKSILSLTIPASVEVIQSGTFSGCSTSIKFTFENQTRFVLSTGILYCDGVFVDYIVDSDTNDIVIPNNINSIAAYMFKNKKMKSLTFQSVSKVTSIGTEAFNGASVQKIVFPPSLNSMAEKCFISCTKLESIVFDGTTSIIPMSAFEGCSALKSITFKDGVAITTFNKYAFKDCANLVSFDFSKLTKLTKICLYAFYNTGIQTIAFPESITTIESNAFQSCKVVSLSYNAKCTITSVSSYCFAQCSKLTTCSLSPLITTIDFYAFYGCSSLVSFRLGKGIQMINQHAFEGSSKLTEVIIPDGSELKNIMGFAFKATNLSYFTIEGSEFSFADGLLMNEAKTNIVYFIPREEVKSIIIPSSIVEICDYAFQYATSLIEVIIPEGHFKKIGYHSFEGCTGLKRIVLPNTLTTIDEDAFKGCNKIKCGGLSISDEMIEQARKAGIQDLLLSDGCRNNFMALIRQKTCKHGNVIYQSIARKAAVFIVVLL